MTDEGLKFVLDTMTWSFSRLDSFANGCKYAWKLTYVDCVTGTENFFSEYGSFLHHILEMYSKGELSLFELNSYYEEHFDEAIPHDAPPNKYIDVRQSYYDKGYDYLSNIDLTLDKYEILGIEKEVRFEMFGKNFVGYIDLLLRDKKTGKIIIVDHKSASIKILKNGKISKSDQSHFDSFKKQLYMYSYAVMQKYGEVSELWWNMFRDQTWIKIPWTQEEYDSTIKWIKDTLDAIEKEVEFLPNCDKFFCWYICDHREDACKYKPLPEKRENNDDGYYNPDTEKYDG